MTLARLALPPDEVHVWRYRLADAVAPEADALSAEERAKGRSFRDEADRGRYALARSGLRRLLAQYTGVDARSLAIVRTCRFCGGDHGKPRLAPPSGEPPLTFNLAHSCGQVVYAVARGQEVGVDVEHLHGDPAPELAASFDPGLLAAVRSRSPQAPASPAPEAMRQWTQLEACLKLSGHGVAPPPGFRPGPFALWSLDLGPGYVGALAAERAATRVRQFDLPGLAAEENQAVKSGPDLGRPKEKRGLLRAVANSADGRTHGADT